MNTAAASTPNIKKLIDRSIYFKHTLVTVPRTGPSWSAELTGLSPLTNGVETMFPTRTGGDLSKTALPAELASRGYRTAVYSEYAGEFFGRIQAGFQVECVPRVELAEISGQTLLARAPLILAQAGNAPIRRAVHMQAVDHPAQPFSIQDVFHRLLAITLDRPPAPLEQGADRRD